MRGGRFNWEGATHCIHGHALTPDNIKVVRAGSDGRLKRRCAACLRSEKRRRQPLYHQRHKQQRAIYKRRPDQRMKHNDRKFRNRYFKGVDVVWRKALDEFVAVKRFLWLQARGRSQSPSNQ